VTLTRKDFSKKFYLLVLLTGMITMNTYAQKLLRNEPVKFLALGDSYTIGESVAEHQRWPVQLVNALMLQGFSCHQPEIVAVAGWRTDDLKKAMGERDLPKDFNLVSLLIGVNNQYQGRSATEYEREFEELLKMAIEYGSGMKSHVFVMSIPDYGYTPFGKEKRPEISQQIDAFNEINKAIAKKHRVTYIYITDISRRGFDEPGLVAEDGLHPSGKMYALWVERILEVMTGVR
jgi:lysophospholipase L1-like esterase